MKIGAKVYGTKDRAFLNTIAEKVDFIETMAIRGADYSFLKRYNKKIVVHAEHHFFGVNPADPAKYKDNLNSINFALKIADKLNAEKVIAHAGVIWNEKCSEETAISFFKELKDRRILIENIPLYFQGRYVKGLCATPKSTAEFIKLTDKKFCFDITHAILSAILLHKKDCNEFMMPYLKLNPSHFHFSDLSFRKLQDHFNLGEGDLDIGFYKKIIEGHSQVTLETAIDIEKVLNDIRMMRA